MSGGTAAGTAAVPAPQGFTPPRCRSRTAAGSPAPPPCPDHSRVTTAPPPLRRRSGRPSQHRPPACRAGMQIWRRCRQRCCRRAAQAPRWCGSAAKPVWARPPWCSSCASRCSGPRATSRSASASSSSVPKCCRRHDRPCAGCCCSCPLRPAPASGRSCRRPCALPWAAMPPPCCRNCSASASPCPIHRHWRPMRCRNGCSACWWPCCAPWRGSAGRWCWCSTTCNGPTRSPWICSGPCWTPPTCTVWW